MTEFFVGKFKSSLTCEMRGMFSKRISGIFQGSEFFFKF